MSHYYSEFPSGSFKKYRFRVRVRGIEVIIESASGVFSARRLDKGTEVLLNYMIVKDGWRMLDLGCGYGIIGIVAAKLAPRGYVILTDINKRAVMLAKRNLALNRVHNAEVRWGDLYEPVRNETFDTIITNPPQATGMKILERIIVEAPRYLKPDGILQFVARHRKGGRRLFEILSNVFPEVETLGSRSGYRVYAGKVGS
ncbi:MAG: 16S rRNA methyltransferase [Thermoprotei archaeon]|nr:MAG: 16S rRNA methyltransferase [Thermoprotei archaeon]RLF01658.1 MAG: 16S rRNA methyltransferase [Thermoprotei archaeon]